MSRVIVDNRSQVRRVLLLTLLLNLLVLVLKGVVGVATGSLSVQADALHSVTDSANNILGLVTNRCSSPHPDRLHPYGHQKFEAIGALGIAAFLGIAFFEILQQAITRLTLDQASLRLSAIELWLLLAVLGVNIFVALYERQAGQQLKSQILIADAYHTMSDVWITITVLGGLIGISQSQAWNLPQLQWLDVILAVPVAGLVFRSGWMVLKTNLPWLVDEMVIAPEVIHTIVMSVPGVLNCHDIASRGMLGRKIFVEMHLVVEAEDISNAHQITEAVEQRLEEQFAPIRTVVHVEPPDYSSESITFGLEQNGTEIKE